MPSKKLFILSIILNLLLIFVSAILLDGYNSAKEERNFSNTEGRKNTEIMKKIFVGKLSKDQIFAIIHQNFKEGEYFDKPSENSIGIGSLNLIFDKNNMLVNVDGPYYEGP